MPKQLQRAEVKTLKGGLITEASPLQFPEGASQDELNFDIKMDGTRSRRLGFDKENGSVSINTGKSWNTIGSVTYKSYLWEQVGGVPGKQFLVVQIGTDLNFFDPTRAVVSQVAPIKISIGGVADRKFGMSDVGGYLVVVTGQSDICIITYNALSNTLSLERARIRIRDQFGIQETQIPEHETNMNHRGGLSTEHYYNLYNQGWAVPRFDFVFNVTETTDAVLLGSGNGAEAFPSNSDTVWMGMQERPIRKEGKDADTRFISAECFHFTQFKAVRGESTPAAKGFFIIDAFNRGASRIEQWEENKRNYAAAGRVGAGIGNPPTDRTTGGPQCVADHAGRVFFAGMQGSVVNGDKRSPNYTNVIFFSQLVKQTADITQCYQEGDPTSRETSDVVDTDGGFLRISEAKNILSMISVGSRLVVLAENGVWAITGGSDYGFSATNYKVERISTYGISAPESMVIEGNTVYFWGFESIYRIGANQMGDFTATDITSERIKKHYATYSNDDKERVTGTYDKYLQRVVWTIPEMTRTIAQGVNNRVLIYDVVTSAFIPYTIMSHSAGRAVLIGGFPSPAEIVQENTNHVTTMRGVDIVTTTGEQVVALEEVTIVGVPKTKHVGLIRASNGIAEIFFGHFHREDFRDWYSVDGVGVDAAAYILTGDVTLNDAGIKKQIPYLTMYFFNTETHTDNHVMLMPSSCLGRIQWDFTNDIRSGRWSREVQMFRRKRHRYSAGDGDVYTGEKILVTKNKVRGNGKAFALHLQTEPGMDLQVVGWNLTMTANGVT